MERTPGIKFIYFNQGFLSKPLWVTEEIQQIGIGQCVFGKMCDCYFLTDEEMLKFDLSADKVAVYVPAGLPTLPASLHPSPRPCVRKIEKITSGEAMNMPSPDRGVVDPMPNAN